MPGEPSSRCDSPGVTEIAGSDRAVFIGITRFDGASFTGDPEFGGVTFTGSAGFVGVTFADNASFSGVTFTGDVGFDGVRVTRIRGFDQVTVVGGARFARVTFLGHRTDGLRALLRATSRGAVVDPRDFRTVTSQPMPSPSRTHKAAAEARPEDHWSSSGLRGDRVQTRPGRGLVARTGPRQSCPVQPLIGDGRCEGGAERCGHAHSRVMLTGSS